MGKYVLHKFYGIVPDDQSISMEGIHEDWSLPEIEKRMSGKWMNAEHRQWVMAYTEAQQFPDEYEERSQQYGCEFIAVGEFVDSPIAIVINSGNDTYKCGYIVSFAEDQSEHDADIIAFAKAYHLSGEYKPQWYAMCYSNA